MNRKNNSILKKYNMVLKVWCGLTLVFLVYSSQANADPANLKQGAEQAGHAVGSVVHKIGKTGKDVGLDVAHRAVDISQAIAAGAVDFWDTATGRGSSPVTSSEKNQTQDSGISEAKSKPKTGQQ